MPTQAVLTPEEAERAARLQAMETTLAALRAQTAENQRTLADVRAQLAESRDSRYLNPLVYVLLALLLTALIAIAMLLRASRQRAAAAWWNDSVVRDDDPRGPVTGGGSSSGGAGRVAAAAVAPAALAASVAKTDDHDQAVKRQQEADADLAPVRNVNTEELFDVQQQSDFFLSLGQHAQAIAVLSEHIAENPQTSALAYLDLLRIHHTLGNRDAYGRVGQEFERAFNATLPSFDNFNDGGNGLEHYRGTMARIAETWPATETLALIEELVFRKPGTDGNEAFDLAAYQELLLLYAVAKEVIDPDSAPPAPVTPISYLDTAAHGPTTAPAPLAAAAVLAPLAFTVDPEPTRPAAFMPYQGESDKSARAAELTESGVGDATVPAPLLAFDMQLDAEKEEDKGEDTHPGDLEGPTARVPLFPEAPLLPADESARRGDPALRTGMDAPMDTSMNTSMDTSMDTISELTRDTTLDSNLIDFELFDPETEAKIAPKPTRY